MFTYQVLERFDSLLHEDFASNEPPNPSMGPQQLQPLLLGRSCMIQQLPNSYQNAWTALQQSKILNSIGESSVSKESKGCQLAISVVRTKTTKQQQSRLYTVYRRPIFALYHVFSVCKVLPSLSLCAWPATRLSAAHRRTSSYLPHTPNLYLQALGCTFSSTSLSRIL